ncbi:EamA/RhaT family transporter, partial [Francisella tularensis subsp. holarctica]|nr:EamA/RhaT family transporter [Francisella tularensis subsp. holarctica]
SGIFWGLDYTLAGKVNTFLTMTFLVSMLLKSIHDLGVAAKIAAISNSSVKRIKDLKLWKIISFCCIPLLGGFAMTMYM